MYIDNNWEFLVLCLSLIACNYLIGGQGTHTEACQNLLVSTWLHWLSETPTEDTCWDISYQIQIV